MNFDRFSEQEYLRANPDVAEAVRLGQFPTGRAHYDAYGKREGRRLSRKGELSRVDKALFGLDRNGLGLEIGPRDSPISPKKNGFNVHILDHLSAADLRAKYAVHEKYGAWTC